MHEPFGPGFYEWWAGLEVALRKEIAWVVIRSVGVQGLHCVEGEYLPDDDGEATVDASHPTDLGMLRMADALEPVLRPLVH